MCTTYSFTFIPNGLFDLQSSFIKKYNMTWQIMSQYICICFTIPQLPYCWNVSTILIAWISVNWSLSQHLTLKINRLGIYFTFGTFLLHIMTIKDIHLYSSNDYKTVRLWGTIVVERRGILSLVEAFIRTMQTGVGVSVEQDRMGNRFYWHHHQVEHI